MWCWSNFNNGLHNRARRKVQKNVRKRSLAELQYADDLVILANTAEEAQRMMDTFSNVYSSLGMEVNTTKTKLLIMSFHPQAASATRRYISIDGAPVETVEQFNYLGSLVTANCDLDAEINHSHAFFKLRERVFGSSDLTIYTKVLVFKAVVLSILLYGSEWVR